jgi:membrane protein YqaA with SNARE-associated domain
MGVSVIVAAALAAAMGSVLPWINGEAVVAGAAVVVPSSQLAALVLACASAQMAGKLGVYALARWAPDRMPLRARRLLSRAERFRERRALLTGAIVTGSMVALPPFYLVTLASGVLRVPIVHFAIAGLCGTLARYGVVAFLAQSLMAA